MRWNRLPLFSPIILPIVFSASVLLLSPTEPARSKTNAEGLWHPSTSVIAKISASKYCMLSSTVYYAIDCTTQCRRTWLCASLHPILQCTVLLVCHNIVQRICQWAHVSVTSKFSICKCLAQKVIWTDLPYLQLAIYLPSLSTIASSIDSCIGSLFTSSKSNISY